MKRAVAVALCALVVVPAAAARPFLGVYGNATRFSSLTGQHTTVQHMYLGWGQGQTWGSSFDRILPTLGDVPLISITTYHWPSTTGVLTPLQIARGDGDSYLEALNAAIARSGRKVFYVRPLGEMTGWWSAWCAYTRDGRPKGPSYSTAAFRKAFARMYLILHGGPAAQIDARLARLGLPLVSGDLASNPFPRLRVIWGAQAHGDPQVPGNAPARYYPGDAYVDVIGDDPYDLGSVDWNAIQRLYEAYPHKGFAFPEWGMRGLDDPAFVTRMASFVRSHRRVELLSFFNGKAGGAYDLASKPRARAAYRKLISSLG
ncbi:MAG TPA: hypothetical protein VEH52_09960 [Gaiellaceae bacterium]|nr:hypothetical protein [Gaiellaceae bacterium]